MSSLYTCSPLILYSPFFSAAFLFATGALGPVLGFALGALMLQFYVDYFSFDYHRLHLTPDDPRWVGAWWGGFIICGVLLIVTSIPFFGFPKVNSSCGIASCSVSFYNYSNLIFTVYVIFFLNHFLKSQDIFLF